MRGKDWEERRRGSCDRDVQSVNNLISNNNNKCRQTLSKGIHAVRPSVLVRYYHGDQSQTQFKEGRFVSGSVSRGHMTACL